MPVLRTGIYADAEQSGHSAAILVTAVSLTMTDSRGFEADQLDIELDDADGKVEVAPARGGADAL